MKKLTAFLYFTPVLLLLLCRISSVYGQHAVKQTDLTDPVFGQAIQASAMAAFQNEIYIASKQCKIILVLNKDMLLSDLIDLSHSKLEGKPVKMGGMAVYKDHLLLTDGNCPAIYNLNLHTRTISGVALEKPKFIRNDKEAQAITGITVDEQNSICYVLKGRHRKDQSIVHVFRINDKNGQLSLQFLRNIAIVQDQSNPKWKLNARYSDICFDPQDQFLYLLRNYTDGKTPANSRYGIDRLNAADYTKIPAQRQAPAMLYAELTPSVTAASTGFSPCLEGMVIKDKVIYAISNNSPDACCCNKAGQGKTLLLAVTK